MSTPTLSLENKATGLWELGKSTKEIAEACGRSLRWAQVQVKEYKERQVVPLTITTDRIVPLTISSLPEKYVEDSIPCEPQEQRYAPFRDLAAAMGPSHDWVYSHNDGSYSRLVETIKNDYVTTYTRGE